MSTAKTQKTLEALGVNKKLAATMSKAEAKRGTPYLARDVFLREMWGTVISAEDESDGLPTWIEEWLRPFRQRKAKPKGLAAALDRALSSGVSPQDLTAIVREMQADALYNLCFALDGDKSTSEGIVDHDIDVDWGLYTRDEAGAPQRRLQDLHESFHSYDPEGKDARNYYPTRK